MNMYQVVNSNTKDVRAEGFDKREHAKIVRDKMNADSNSDSIYIVSRGSEHPRGQTFGPVNQSKRWL